MLKARPKPNTINEEKSITLTIRYKKTLHQCWGDARETAEQLINTIIQNKEKVKDWGRKGYKDANLYRTLSRIIDVDRGIALYTITKVFRKTT